MSKTEASGLIGLRTEKAAARRRRGGTDGGGGGGVRNAMPDVMGGGTEADVCVGGGGGGGVGAGAEHCGGAVIRGDQRTGACKTFAICKKRSANLAREGAA
ncbi:hypothetical protein FGB62_2g116 [Gracilaria domingensis]|nr:hypothetical protein FGB62_2g116 [Gracilaria domingensis]